jgi:filamentous hemagglutinin family protein
MRNSRRPANGQVLPGRRLFALIFAAGCLACLKAAPLPNGAAVAAGDVAISSAAQVMTVRQASDKAIINWDGFSVAAGHRVDFVQPGSTSVTLNRVVGADASAIHGAITSNGRVFLSNPNGILFGPGAQVNVGGMLASTLAMTDADFLAGRYGLAGASSSAIINQGNIVAQPDGRGGEILMVAARITNEGTMVALGGTVMLAAASQVTLDLGGVVRLTIKQGAIDALVANGGAIHASGGLVLLTAAAVSDLPSAMVNHAGLIEAQTLATGEEGRIFLLADMQAGTVVADGRLDVSAPLGGDGGFVETSAARVLVRDGFRVDALSAFGKTGTWLLDPDVLNITATGTDILSGLPLTGDSFVSVATLNTALSSADVELQANSHIDIRTAFTYAGSRDAKLSLYAPLVLLGADIGSASAANLSLRFGGLFAGNGINYAGDLYLYDAAAGATTTRVITTQGGDVVFNGNIGGSQNLTISAGAGTVTHFAAVDGIFNTLLPVINGAIALDFKPGHPNAHVIIDYTTQQVFSQGSPIAFTGTMPFGFVRIPAQVLQLNAQNMVGGSPVSCVFTLTDGTTLSLTPDPNGHVTIPYLLQVTQVEYYTANASAANFQINTVTYDVLVPATPVHEYLATASVVTLASSAALAVDGGISLVAGRFVNGAGSAALAPGAGLDWRVWSSNPDPFDSLIGDETGGLVYDYRQYDLAYTPGAVGLLGTGDGFIYTFAPSLGFALTGSVTKTYDGTNTVSNLTSANYAVSGAVGGDAVSITGGLPTSGIYSSPHDVGSGLDVTVTGITANILATNLAGQADVFGYRLSAVPATGPIGAITQAPLTITAEAANKTYDGLAYAGAGGVTYVGFVNGETESVLGGTLAFGVMPQPSIDVGTYTVTPGGLNSDNYAIQYVGNTLTVGQALLTITANSVTRTYDGLAFTGGGGVTYAGFAPGDTSAVVVGAPNYGGSSQNAVNAGSYVLSVSGMSATNYAIAFVPGTLIVDPAALIITANAANKTYDGLAFTGGTGVTYAGFVNDETASVLGGALTYGGTAQNAVSAGSYALTAGGQTSGNYLIQYVPDALTVDQAPLTITANAANKTYDGLAYVGGNGVTYVGLVNNETESVLGGTLVYGATPQPAIDVGTYVLTPAGLTSNNYAIQYFAGALVVDPAALIVTVNAATKTYDGLAYADGNGVTYAGFVNNETESVLGSVLTYGGSAQNAINVGAYALTANGLNSLNYTIQYVGDTLTVSQAPLMVTANAATKTYDGLAYAGGNGVTYAGFVNNETSSVLTGALTYGGAAQNAINAGSYSLTALGLTSANYAIQYVSGSLTVDPAALTVTANAANKTYDGLAYVGGNGVTYVGLVNNETESVLGGTLVYGATPQPAIDVGTYALTPAGLSSNNYAIQFVAGALTIDRALLTVTANAASKTYDGLAYTGGNGVTYAGFVNSEAESVLAGTPIFGGTAQGAINAGSFNLAVGGLASGNYDIQFVPGSLAVDPAVLMITANAASKTHDGLAFAGGNGVTYAGLVNNETPAVLNGQLAYGGTSQGAIEAGSYTLTAGGQASANYAIQFAPALLTILPSADMVDPIPYLLPPVKSKPFAILTQLPETSSPEYFVGGLDYVYLERPMLLAKGLATAYAQLNEFDLGVLKYDGGTLLVSRTPLKMTVNDAAKIYDALDHSGGTVTYKGFIKGETSASLGGTLVYGGSSQGAVAAGSYPITASGLTSAGYDLSYAEGVLLVSKAPLSVTAVDVSKLFDAVPYSGGGGVTYGGLKGGQTGGILGGALTYAGTAQGAVLPGSYVLMPGGLSSPNYAITYLGGTLTILPGGVAVVAVPSLVPTPAVPPNRPMSTAPAVIGRVAASSVLSREQILVRRSVEATGVILDAGAPLDPSSAPRTLHRPVKVLVHQGGVNLGGAVLLAE